MGKKREARLYETGTAVLALLLLVGLIALVQEQKETKKPEIIVNAYTDETVMYENYTHFFLLPVAPENNLYLRSTEQVLLKRIGEVLIKKGVSLVRDINNAEAVVCIFFDAPYREYYVPPRQISIPVYKPGKTEYFSGFIGGEYYWGSYETPGEWQIQTYQRPGYYKGYFFPFVRIDVVDIEKFVKTRKIRYIWTGTAITVSQEADIRKTGLPLIEKVLEKWPFPIAKTEKEVV